MDYPEVPLERSQEDITERAHESSERWIMGVALTAALLAVIASVTALVVEHHADEAMILQIQSSDQWNFYQAKSLKANLLSAKDELLTALGKTADEKDAEKLAQYKKEQDEIREAAEEKQQESAAHLRHHTILSRSLTMFQVAIAIGAIAALTRRKLFWFLSLAFGLVGLVFFVHGVLVA